MMKLVFVDNTDRAEQFQAMRFFAFIIICLYHLSDWMGRFFPGMEWAYCSVSFFFMLSGFVLAYSSYEKEIVFSFRTCLEHFFKKVKRIYPLYLGTTLVTVLISEIPYLVSAREYADLKLELIQLMKNLLLIQSWFSKGHFSFNGVGWYLSSLLFIALFDIPLIYWGNKIKANKKNISLYLIGIIISFAVLTIYSILFKDFHKKFMLYVFPIGRVWEYIIGIFLGYIAKIVKCKESRLNNPIVCTVFEVCSLAFCVFALNFDTEKWKTYTIMWVIPNAIILLVYGLGGGYISKLFRLKVLNSLGNISFECYLIHQVLIKIFAEKYGYNSLGGLANLLIISLVILITVLLALLIHGKQKRIR